MSNPGRLNGLIWHNTYWLAYGDRLSTSADGVNWSTSSQSTPNFTSVNNVIWTGTQWVAYGHIPPYGSNNTFNIKTSSDGKAWVEGPSAPVLNYGADSYNYYGIFWNSLDNKLYTFGGHGDERHSTFAYNYDFSSSSPSWVGRQVSDGQYSSIIRGMFMHKGQAYIMGEYGIYKLGDSGIWSLDNGSSSSLNEIFLGGSITLTTYTNNETLIHIGQPLVPGDFAITQNVNNWTKITGIFTDLIRGALYNGEYWVVIADKIAKSKDGISWEISPQVLDPNLGVKIMWKSPFWYIAFSSSSKIDHVIITSNDGINWRHLPTKFDKTYGCSNIAYNNQYWLGLAKRTASVNSYFISKSAFLVGKTLFLQAPSDGPLTPLPKPLYFTYLIDYYPNIYISVLRSSLKTYYSNLRVTFVDISNGIKHYNKIVQMPLISGSYTISVPLNFIVKIKDKITFNLINLEGQKTNGKWYSIGYLKKKNYEIV